MKHIKNSILPLLLFCFGTTFSQTTDSLSVSPNPFSSSAVIHFDIAQTDTITLRVFTMTAQVVETYFQSTILPSGSYNIHLIGDSLADGMYLIRLEIGTTKSLNAKVVKKSSTTSIQENKLLDNIFLFPNPTTNFITIPMEGRKTIVLTDLNGKIVQKIETDKQTISLSELEAEEYYITIVTSKNEIITTRIIVKNK